MPQIGPLEILVVFIVALLVFGPKEIPRVARQAARAWRDVQRFQATVRREIDDVLRDIDDDEDEDDEDDGREEQGRPPTLPPKQAELSAGAAPGPDVAAEEPPDASPPADPTP
jgi:TatA/E family protein of Tat protein translocase